MRKILMIILCAAISVTAAAGKKPKNVHVHTSSPHVKQTTVSLTVNQQPSTNSHRYNHVKHHHNSRSSKHVDVLTYTPVSKNSKIYLKEVYVNGTERQMRRTNQYCYKSKSGSAVSINIHVNNGIYYFFVNCQDPSDKVALIVTEVLPAKTHATSDVDILSGLVLCQVGRLFK